MSDGTELPAWAKPRRPEGRPTWVVVLALLMLVFGGYQLLGGVPRLSGASVEVAVDPDASADAKQTIQVLNDSMSRIARENPGALRASGASKVLLGALLLFVVAAVFAGDPRA